MDTQKMAELEEKWRRGAQITNKGLTKEIRSKAAKKGYRNRRKRLAI